MDDTETYLNFRNIPFGNFSLFSNYEVPDIAFGTFGSTGLVRTVPLVTSLSVSHHQVTFDHLALYQTDDITETSTTKIPTEDFWVERFAELKEFKEEYDHCNPSYMQHSQLYSWLHRQKFLFRKGKLPKDRFLLLSELGVQFDYHWEEMYQQLKEFREYQMQSEVEVPFDTKLSSWIWAQIYAWRQGKLSRERVKKLENLGFTHDCEAGLKPPKPQSKKKRQRFLRIQQHQQQQDAIPLAEIQEDEEEEEEEETEVMAQPPLLPDFELPPPVPLPEKTTKTITERKSDQNWLTMYEKLKVFKNTQNSLVVPAKHDKKLHLWLRTQRKTWRDGRLAPWKQKKLQNLGIELNNQSKLNGEEVNHMMQDISFPVHSEDVYKVVH